MNSGKGKEWPLEAARDKLPVISLTGVAHRDWGMERGIHVPGADDDESVTAERVAPMQRS